jgi:hypothetical protein
MVDSHAESERPMIIFGPKSIFVPYSEVLCIRAFQTSDGTDAIEIHRTLGRVVKFACTVERFAEIEACWMAWGLDLQRDRPALAEALLSR